MDIAQPGTQINLVFRAQPFAPVANQETRTMDLVLNVISGTYRGEENDRILFETETPSGMGVVWRIKMEDVLMFGLRCDTPRLARV